MAYFKIIYVIVEKFCRDFKCALLIWRLYFLPLGQKYSLVDFATTDGRS